MPVLLLVGLRNRATSTPVFIETGVGVRLSCLAGKQRSDYDPTVYLNGVYMKKILSIPEHKSVSKFLQLTLLEVSVFNPEGRTAPRALAKLKDDIEKNGILSDIHVLPGESGKYTVVDGHRRVEAARQLELKSVKCTIHDLSTEWALPLWGALNRSTRGVNSFEWMEVWYKSNEKIDPPAIHKYAIQSCMTIFGGRKGIEYLLSNNIAPSICKLILAISAQFDRCSSVPSPSQGDLGRWIVEHRAQAALVPVRGQGRPMSHSMLKRLAKRVKENQALQSGDLDW
jgi:hypothetical protein